MKALELLKIVFEIILFFMLLATINALVSGCSVLQPAPVEKITTNTEVLYKTIKSTNWVLSFLLIGFVCGLIGSFGLGFKKLGLVTSGACIAGIFLSAAISNTWFYIGAGLVVFASILMVVAGLLLKHKAVVELVKGIESVKNSNSDRKQQINGTLSNQQAVTTRQLVDGVKTGLKLKGEI